MYISYLKLNYIRVLAIILSLFAYCHADLIYAEAVATGPSNQTGPIQTATLDRPAKSADPQPDANRIRFDTMNLEPEALVGKILAEMTLEEKISQMCQIFPGGETLSEDLAGQIRQGLIGSIFYTANPRLTRRAQEVAVEESRLGIPLIVGRDVIHGLRTVFPIPIGQACSWNPEIVREAAEVAAEESRYVGIHWTFAPMLDVSRDPRWGRVAESLGEDPFLTAELGVAMVEGFQAMDESGMLAGIAACPKHFIGYGLAEGGRDYNRVMVSRNELRNVYLMPFKSCIDANAFTLMSAFNSVNGVPASGHQYLLRDLLKEEWGFKGFVVSDWASITEMIAHGYVSNNRGAARAALRAGVDMEMVSTSYRKQLPELLNAGTISEDLIDEAVSRILFTKASLGLFEDPYADRERTPPLAAAHRRVARQAARQSMVLLKNNGVLPLDQKKINSVAVIGPLSDAPKDQLGTWVLDGNPDDTITPIDAIKQVLGADVDITHVPCLPSKYDADLEQFEAAVAAAKNADIVLSFVGEEEALSGEAHCRTNLNLPGSQDKLIKSLAELDVPVVMVVLAGRPLTIGKQVKECDAVLYAWHPGTMGGLAITDLLFGKQSPSGKLPITFPKTVGQVPLYYNHLNTGRPASPNYTTPELRSVKTMPENIRYSSHYVDSDPFPLFPFGFGLSYTTFEYSNLEISDTAISEGDTLTVTVDLSNTGECKGTEIVQLYVRDKVASTLRPVKELKGFQRVTLMPNETTKVEFTLTRESLGFYNEQEEFAIEPGQFNLWVGGDSTATLSTKFKVE